MKTAKKSHKKSRFIAQTKSEFLYFRWKKELSFEEIEEIQDICGQTLHRLGYNFIHTQEDITDKNFDTLGSSEYQF